MTKLLVLVLVLALLLLDSRTVTVAAGAAQELPSKCGSGWQKPYRRLHESTASLLHSTPPSEV